MTDVLLFASVILEDDAVEEFMRLVNAYPGFSGRRGMTAMKDDWYGGSKVMQAFVAGGAFNYLDITGFVEHLRGIRWGETLAEPLFVQLCIQHEDDEGFAIVEIYRPEPSDGPFNPEYFDIPPLGSSDA